ncbi:hypothetical protein [Dokdonia sp. Hel_I_53]|uniref:hypothetical protein n=1 Tax=Dokdonia sp. Hel_I_53 TaxID=1566287 RepID=UPI00119BC47B|nr:hypothetical protein [Dokdonia sp. Hel_I_53]TVZ52802.1 hypothetical protein OD90_1986 [Dokdonia sp. Hel_I_53]
MIKTLSLISFLLFMTASILGPSYLSLCDNGTDIEHVQDFDEESKKDSKKEIEEVEKFFEKNTNSSFNKIVKENSSNFFYQEKVYSYSLVVKSPPPKHFT